MRRQSRLKLLLSIVSVLLCSLSNAQINTERMITVGRNALYFEDYVLSIQYFNQVINVKPFLYEPYFYRAVAKLSLEDFRGAEEDCNQSINRNPFVVNSYQVRGLARINQGKFAEAIEDYKIGLSLDPENVSLRHNYVYCLVSEKNEEMAMKAIDTLLLISPNYSPAMSMRSNLFWNKNDTLQAMFWINKAIQTDKFNPSLYQERGILLAKMEKYSDSEIDMNQSIYLESDNSSYYVNRALVRYYQNNLRGALSDYDLAIQTDKGNTMAFYNRGLLRAQVGDDNRAIEDFDEVIKSDPNNYFAIFNRGQLRMETGDYTGSENDLSKVLDEYPDFIPGYSLRSQVRSKLGNRSGSEEDELIVLKEQTRRFNKVMGVSSNEDTKEKSQDDKTRKQSDKNIQNYKKIIVSDDLTNNTGYSSDYRGRVQNRNFDVKFLPQYHLSYFRRIDKVDRRVIFSPDVEKINEFGSLISKVFVSNNEISLSETQITLLFEDIDKQTKLITEHPDKPEYYFARALDFYHLQDFSSSEVDFTQAIKIDEKFWPAYFCRGIVRTKMIEIKNSENPIDVTFNAVGSDKILYKSDYQLVLNDMTDVLESTQQFAYAYYNRATVEAIINDYHAALVDFDNAIALDDGFAEAYYNRGLVLIFLNRMDEAVKDLSKAGELGIYSAYNVIKRFSSSD